MSLSVNKLLAAWSIRFRFRATSTQRTLPTHFREDVRDNLIDPFSPTSKSWQQKVSKSVERCALHPQALEEKSLRELVRQSRRLLPHRNMPQADEESHAKRQAGMDMSVDFSM